MSRATVEIEMPERCLECPFEFDYYCLAGRMIIDDECIHTERDKRCPLKEVESAGEGTDECDGDSCPIRFSGDQ